MPTYFSTFTSGLKDIIPELLKSHVKDAQISHISDGLVSYQTNLPWQTIKKLPMFSNSFYSIKKFEGQRDWNLKSMYKWAIENNAFEQNISNFIENHRTSIRIMASQANLTVPIPATILKQIEHKLIRLNNIVIDRRNPRFELWFIERTEKVGLVGIRITQHSKSKKDLQKGEL